MSVRRTIRRPVTEGEDPPNALAPGIPRVFTHADRQSLDRATEHYLRACYRLQTAARVSELASYLGVTAPDLSRTARQILGKTLGSFLREKQLAYAVQLLRSTPLTMEEIAVRCAFGTPSTFYRWFTERYGMPPAAFRQVMK